MDKRPSRSGTTTEWRKLKRRVHERDGYMCLACGRSEDDGVKLHADHIVRYADGGADTMENLQTLCNACHKTKTRAENSTKKPYVPEPTRDW